MGAEVRARILDRALDDMYRHEITHETASMRGSTLRDLVERREKLAVERERARLQAALETLPVPGIERFTDRAIGPMEGLVNKADVLALLSEVPDVHR